MSDRLTNQNKEDSNIDINYFELLSLIFIYKYSIAFSCLLFSLLGIMYSFSLDNIYKSEAILAHASGHLDRQEFPSGVSNIASFAGITIEDNKGERVSQGIEIIKSLAFFDDLQKDENLLKKLIAAKGWDAKKNLLIIDNKIFDESSQSWVYDGVFANNGKPSLQSSHRNFLKNLLIEKESGLVKISYLHYSPFVSREVVSKIILKINERTRNDDLKIANSSIQFLKLESSKTQLRDIKSGINELIKSQLEVISLANATPEYLFKVLSEPYAPEIKQYPRRLNYFFSFLVIGFLCSFFFITAKNYKKFLSFNKFTT